MNFHSTQMNRHKYVHWMATYRLRVHQFTTEQVGKGDKKETTFTHHTKSMLSIHKHAHSKATYILRVHQFTIQVGKGDKRRNEFWLNTKWVCTNMFIEWQLTDWEWTSSQHSKWTKEKQTFTQHKINVEYAQRHWFKSNLQPESAPVPNTASG